MTKLINLETHFAITKVREIDRIVRPLTELLHIPYFRYLKLYFNGKRVLLSNYPDLLRYIYGEGHYEHMWFDGGFNDYWKAGWNYRAVNHLLDQREVESQTEQDLKTLLNMTEGMAYIQFGENFCEMFAFDSDNVDLYQTDKKLLTRFMFYFKKEASKLLIQAEKEKFFASVQPDFQKRNDLSSSDKARELLSYLESTKTNRYYLGGHYSDTYLTEKEIHCIRWLVEGKSADEIALFEGAALKTVRCHIDNIKIKLHCQKQTEIVRIFLNSGLADLCGQEYQF